jgi:DNA mismatch repair protein MutS
MEWTLAQVIDGGVKLTPMMEQYSQVKKLYPNVLVLFRMGDFYEVFFEDARSCAKLLNISLTHRGKLGDIPIPMAGIPHHAASTYIDRLTQMGQKVVICDQVEDPKEAKGIVKRAVTQVVSPGMPYDLDRIMSSESRFIACAYKSNSYYLVLLDYTTGDFLGLELKDEASLIEKIQLYSPYEFVSSLGQWDDTEFLDFLQKSSILHTHLSQESFEPKFQKNLISKFIPHFERDKMLASLPDFLIPLSGLSTYVISTQQKEIFTHLRPFRILNLQESMKVSFATLRGLEIFPRDKDAYNYSLLGFMDHTQSSMGSRALKQIFQSPLRSKKEMEKRFDLLEALIKDQAVLEKIRQEFKETWDMDRIMCKISTGKVNASDLLNLAKTLSTFARLEKLLASSFGDFFPPLGSKISTELKTWSTEVLKTINPEPGASYDKGNLVLLGVNSERDKLANFHSHVASELLDLETRYRSETGINNLKIKSNNISGYFIEVSLSHLKKVPSHFKRTQTLVNNERYVTQELETFERKVVSAEDKLRKVEKEIFDVLVGTASSLSAVLLDVAKRLSHIDVFASLAWVARLENFVRPSLVTEKKTAVTGAWHPLIRKQIKDQFVSHNLSLDEKCTFGLITGPNMAGKTTVMREIAIIQFLAQIGSFVPAHSAELSIKDYLFSRLGASDDIIRGQSTFMVEMSETAEILRHASSESLIVLDEIGRGTSTYDGLAIAWSLVEYFVKELKALTLFATHYHELIELVDSLDHAQNFTVRTEQRNGKVHFLYDLVPHGATQSFGVHVAELAGLPNSVLKRSRELLRKFEKHQSFNDSQLTLFDQPAVESSLVENELKALDLNQLTPLQALNQLSKLRDLIQ